MQTINLTQNNFKMAPVVYMVQNDTGRSLKMILDDVTLAGTESGAVAIRRSDGSYYTITATLVAADNAFTIEADQALTQPGKTECQLKVTDSNNDVISSYTFCIMVQPSTDGIQESQLGYSVQQLRQDAEDIRTGGMPADLRLALLQLAQKVAYIDDNGPQYYQDLYDALLPAVILTGITAVYTQSGTVYDTDSLDDLKADLVVTASYSDGTTETLLASAYTLSGSLTVGTSTITVTYEDKTTTFNVVVSSHILYTLPEAKTFNGSSDYVNTGVKLLSVDRDFTITFTAANGTVDQQDPIFHCLTEESPYPGLSLQRINTGNYYNIGGLRTNTTATSCRWASGYTNKCVFRHTAGTSVYILSSKTGNTLNSPITVTAESGHVTTDKNLLIGCYQQTDGTLGRFWNGTVNDFTIYDRVLSDDEVATYLGS